REVQEVPVFSNVFGRHPGSKPGTRNAAIRCQRVRCSAPGIPVNSANRPEGAMGTTVRRSTASSKRPANWPAKSKMHRPLTPRWSPRVFPRRDEMQAAMCTPLIGSERRARVFGTSPAAKRCHDERHLEEDHGLE